MRSTDITSFTEFRSHRRDHLDRRKETSRPLFVTNNGQTEAVVLSPEMFGQLINQAELGKSLDVIDRSLYQVKSGKGTSLKRAIREIAGELGLKLKR